MRIILKQHIISKISRMISEDPDYTDLEDDNTTTGPEHKQIKLFDPEALSGAARLIKRQLQLIYNVYAEVDFDEESASIILKTSDFFDIGETQINHLVNDCIKKIYTSIEFKIEDYE